MPTVIKWRKSIQVLTFSRNSLPKKTTTKNITPGRSHGFKNFLLLKTFFLGFLRLDFEIISEQFLVITKKAFKLFRDASPANGKCLAWRFPPPPASGANGLLQSSQKWRRSDCQVGGGRVQSGAYQESIYSQVQVSPLISATKF